MCPREINVSVASFILDTVYQFQDKTKFIVFHPVNITNIGGIPWGISIH